MVTGAGCVKGQGIELRRVGCGGKWGDVAVLDEGER